MRRIAVAGLTLLLIALAALSTSVASSASESSSVVLRVNGQAVHVPEGYPPIVIVDGRVVVPIRLLSEAMGARVEWDQETRTVDLYVGSDGLVQAPPEGWEPACLVIGGP